MTTQTATSAATTLSIQGSRCSSLTSVSSAMSITSLSGLNLGDRVAVKSSRKLISLRRRKPKTGLVRFLGDTQFAVGQWVGIELDEPCGNSDGSVDGMRYFQCRPNHGFFAPVHKVSHSAAGGARSAARLAAQDKACPQDDGLPQNMENSGNVENVLQTQIRLLEAAADQKNVENGRLQGQLEEASRIAQEFREKHRVCSERCSSLMAEIDGFEEALRQANQALRQQEMDAESAKQNTRHLQVQVEELGRRAADSELAAQTLRQEKSAVQLELGQLSESCKEAAQSRLQLDNELSSTRETIVDLRSAVAKLEQEKMELHARAEQLDLATGSFKAEGEAKDRLIADLIKDQETCDFELEEMKQQENVLLLSIQQLETDQIKCKEEAQSLREAAAALRAEKTQWLEDKSNLLRTIEDLNSQLIEAATLKEQCNQQSIEADRLRTALHEERRRSDELRAAVDAGETQCRQMAQRSDQLLAQNQNFLEALNKMNQEKMQQIEGEKQVAVQLAVEIRDELKHFNDKILERDQSSEEERTDSKQRVAHMEQALSETEKHLLQLRQEVDNLKKKAYASPHPRNSGGVPALRNPRYNSHIWRDYLILSAIRHSRLYRRRW